MNEPFYLNIDYQGKELELPARFERWGHSHRFAVLLGEDSYFFEPDEVGRYRAYANGSTKGTVELVLFDAISKKLASLLDH